ncbi:hypothetical protein [Pseudomonas putida]|uniref:hypothetical protein n=1 Tax=Pseudomonas putida TaxID=303 RepID=UPI0009A15C70|nr:hypothetical protein [Pseudomonas putida]
MQSQPPEAGGAKATTGTVGAVAIHARLSAGSYIAKAERLKPTASSTISAEAAVKALVIKLGLAPDLLVQQASAGRPGARFTHPGTANQEASS